MQTTTKLKVSIETVNVGNLHSGNHYRYFVDIRLGDELISDSNHAHYDLALRRKSEIQNHYYRTGTIK